MADNIAIGAEIARLRKEAGLTQAQLAEKVGVTDKAVSKWERGISLPDISIFPVIAEELGTTVDSLMLTGMTHKEPSFMEKHGELINTIFSAVGVAMGVAVVALSIMKQIDVESSMTMLGIGLACVAIAGFNKKKDSDDE